MMTYLRYALQRIYIMLFKRNFYTGFKHGKNFSSNTAIDSLFPELIEIGNHFISAPGSRILAHDASLLLFARKIRAAKTVLGEYVFLGANAVVMPGVCIGDRVIVGAGAIVTKNVPSNSVVAGNPARVICSVDEYVAKCESKGQLFDVSESYIAAIDQGVSKTIRSVSETRKIVYDQIKCR